MIFCGYLPTWRIDILNEITKMFDLTIFFLQSEKQGFTYCTKQLISQLKNVTFNLCIRIFLIKEKAFTTPTGQNPEEFFIFEKRHKGILIAIFHYITNHLRVIMPTLWKK